MKTKLMFGLIIVAIVISLGATTITQDTKGDSKAATSTNPSKKNIGGFISEDH